MRVATGIASMPTAISPIALSLASVSQAASLYDREVYSCRPLIRDSDRSSARDPLSGRRPRDMNLSVPRFFKESLGDGRRSFDRE